jgi:ABC-type antimicrobial peptide transport system permease subunit
VNVLIILVLFLFCNNKINNIFISITSIIYLIIGISVTLAFVGIINNQVISFISRKKELAILNSTCMNKTQIKKMLALETIVANIVALGIAVVVTILTTSFIDRFLQNIGLFLEIKFDLMVVLSFSAIIYIILLFTLIFPFRRLKKMNIVEEIKYE